MTNPDGSEIGRAGASRVWLHGRVEEIVDLANAMSVPMETAGRLGKLDGLLGEMSIDVLMVTGHSNIRYLSGFTGSAGTLIVPRGHGQVMLVTDGRYTVQATTQTTAWGADIEVVNASSDASHIEAARDALGVGEGAALCLGLEADHVSWARAQRLIDALGNRGEIQPCRGVVERLRIRKDAGEIARIGAAAAVADAALRRALGEARLGVTTEMELALMIDSNMRSLGAAGAAFDTIVASGPNGAEPHARPRRRILNKDELVVVDFGAVVDGYRSDMTRTVCLGGSPAPELAGVFEVVRAAQSAGVAAVRAGVAAAAVDAACRKVISDAGFAERFVHATGHGVGLDVHEAPGIGENSTANLEPEAVVTVEPGIYLPDLGGVRIEDTVAVTDEGCTVLTATPKDMHWR